MTTLRKLRAVKTIQRHGRAYIHMERLMKDINQSLKRAIKNKIQGLCDDLIDDISQQPRDMYYDKGLKEDYRRLANKVWSRGVKRSRDESSPKFSKTTKRWIKPTEISHYYIEKDMKGGDFKVKETELRDGTFTIKSEFSNFVVKAYSVWSNKGSLTTFINDYKGGKFFSELGHLFEEAMTDLDKKGKYTVIQNKTPTTLKKVHQMFIIELYQKYLAFQLGQIA